MAEDIDIEARIADRRASHPGGRIDCYQLFEDHTDAMAMYRAARARNLAVRVSTTPRQARACCGVALLVSADDARAVLDLAREEHLAFEDMIALECQIDPHRDRYC